MVTLLTYIMFMRIYVCTRMYAYVTMYTQCVRKNAKRIQFCSEPKLTKLGCNVLI